MTPSPSAVAAAGDTVVRFELRGAAMEALRSRENEFLLSGGAGTGKSVGILLKIHLACMRTPRVRALVVRKTHASLTASTLVTFREQVATEAIGRGAVRWFGGSGQEPAQYRYANGSVMVVGGLDRPSRMLSTEYDLIFISEATEVTAEDVDTLITRLRNGVLSYQQLLMDANPSGPSHHLFRRCAEGRCLMLYSKHEDNPRMHDGTDWTEYGKTYLARLGNLTGVRRARLLEGRWVAAEGLVYDYDPAIHLSDRFGRFRPPPADWPRWLAIDFGFTNPLTCQWWTADPDGRLYMYREIYMSRRLVEDHAKAILKAHGGEPKPRAVICDHDAEDRATLERHLGWRTVAAWKPVTAGIDAVAARLKVQPDGKPRLFICRDTLVERDKALAEAHKPCCFADEIVEYVWDTRSQPGGDNLRETPVKEGDHGCDGARYLVAHRDLKPRARLSWIG